MIGSLEEKGRHSILQSHAALSSQVFILQQDNDPKHTSRLGATSEENKTTMASTVIELVWDELDGTVKAKQPASATHLWEPLQQC